MFQVYKITNKLNDRFYIGVHNGDIFKDNYYGSGKIIKQAIKKYGKESFSRKVISEHNTEKGAYKKESDLITKEDINGRECYNITEGGGNPPTWYGDDHPNCRFTEEKRKDICKSYLSGETTTALANRYDTSKAAICYVLEVNDIERRGPDYDNKPTGKDHHNWVDKDEDEICNRYKNGESTYKIAEDIGCSEGTIANVLKDNNIPRRGNIKAVLQFLKNGVYVGAYKSAHEASRISGVSRPGISSCCAGNQKTSCGFKWRYVKYGW